MNWRKLLKPANFNILTFVMTTKIITLTTDFGTRDGFVGIMKGVILSIAPETRIVDIGHWVRPQDVLEGQFLLVRAVPYFPKGAIHVAVIDPDVGTSRRPIAVEKDGMFFIGPDNGVFTPWLDGAKVYHLTNTRYFLDKPSATFHGRDIFAPVSAHLAKGVPLAEMGELIEDPVRLEIPKPKIKKGTIRGEVIHIDYFGNLITNIPASAMEPFLQNQLAIIGHHKSQSSKKVSLRTEEEKKAECGCVITIAKEKIYGLVSTYGSEPDIKTYVFKRDETGGSTRPIPLIALIGSHGYLEIAVPMGNAKDVLNARRGDTVTVRDK